MMVRLAEPADHAALVELARDFYAGTGDMAGLPFDIETTAWWTERAIANALALIAETETGAIAGGLALDEAPPRYSKAPALWDMGFYVLPEHRKSRAAMLLRDAAKAIAADMGLPLFLGVSSGFQIARQDKFFTRAGFRPVGSVYLLR